MYLTFALVLSALLIGAVLAGLLCSCFGVDVTSGRRPQFKQPQLVTMDEEEE